jgi:hypothetical protein
MAEDEDREKPTKLSVLPKKEGANLYGTYLYVQRLKYSTYVRTCTRNCITIPVVARQGVANGNVEQNSMAAKPLKDPGEDRLPAMVRKQLWPVAKDQVHLSSDLTSTQRVARSAETCENHPF